MLRAKTRSRGGRITVSSVLVSMLVVLGLLIAPGAASAHTKHPPKAPTKVSFSLVGKDAHVKTYTWGYTVHEKLYLAKKRVGELSATCWYVDRKKTNHKIYCVGKFAIAGHGTIVVTARGHENDTTLRGRVIGGTGVFKGISGKALAQLGEKKDVYTFWVTLAKPLPKGHPALS